VFEMEDWGAITIGRRHPVLHAAASYFPAQK
jgi:hypothetical protein